MHGEVCESVQADEPTEEQISALHAQYVASLKAAFDEGKGAAGYGSQHLVVD